MGLDYSAVLNNPMQDNLAGDVDALNIEKFNGRVHKAALMSAHIKPFFNFTPMQGTHMISNNSMGDAGIVRVTAGVEPVAGQVAMGRNEVTVDAPIMCRTIIDVLSDVKDRLGVRSRLPETYGRAIQKLTDKTLLVQTNKGARLGASPISEIVAGINFALSAAGDELDPDKLDIAFLRLAQELDENEIETHDGVIAVAPAQYYALLQSDKLISRDFSVENGSYAEAALMKSGGLTILKTNRLPQAVDDGTTPGSVANVMGTAYQVTAAEAKVVANYFVGDSLLVAEAIPLQSKIWWNDTVLSWFIDAFTAFGCTPDRQDYTGAIDKV